MHDLKSPNGIMFSYFDEGESMLLGGHKGPLLVGGLMGGRVARGLGSWGWGMLVGARPTVGHGVSEASSSFRVK